MSELVKLNDLTLGIDNVWLPSKQEKAFNYSDGAQAEQSLYRVLSTAKDLSSESGELAENISDWPTEYHLSAARANLLKPFKIIGRNENEKLRILEIGCGCGSITRFLAERKNVVVDAVEGSPIRAGLAAMRCRDLDNVTICAANINDLNLPQAHYDLVVLVGVCEYAGRFSKKKDDVSAVVELLNKARLSLNINGRVITAIENRLGLKYLLGANEDHYAQAYIGLDDYPESTGIRTYSRDQWRGLIKRAQFVYSHFLLPFPDYKIPSVITSEDLDSNTIRKVLDKAPSRDYSRPDFNGPENEERVWQGLAQSGKLSEHANSFLIVLSNAQRGISDVREFEVAKYAYLEPTYCNKGVNTNETTNVVAESGRQVDSKTIERLQAEITQLQTHTSNLERKVKIMANSIGWRGLNVVRRFLGRSGV